MTRHHLKNKLERVGEDGAEEMQGRQTMTTPNLQALLFLHRTSWLNFRIPQVYPFVTINLGLESLLTLDYFSFC